MIIFPCPFRFKITFIPPKTKVGYAYSQKNCGPQKEVKEQRGEAKKFDAP